MGDVFGIPVSTLTPVGLLFLLIVLIITSFVRGWIIAKWVAALLIEQATLRAEEWRQLYLNEKERADVLQEVAAKMTTLGEASAKILEALPHPGDTRTEKV